MSSNQFVIAVALLSAPFVTGSASADQAKKPMAVAPASVDRGTVDRILATWTPRPVLAAQQMLAKYGTPQEANSERLVWHNQGPYKRITVTKIEIPHDFPKPHMDYLMHTVDYRVPSAKATALVAFDGSVIVDKTAGEMSARCDLEGHNILTLNLANDIATGKTDAKRARTTFGKNVVADVKGEKPPYVTTLQFVPAAADKVRDADVSVIPGSPKRAADMTMDSGPMTDAEILAMVAAVDENHVLAGAEAAAKKTSPQVLEYARMLHVAHGKNAEATLKLGAKIKVTPIETARVDKMRVKGAGELAALVPLDGDRFGTAFMAGMIKGHTEVLAMIDSQLLTAAKHDLVKKHLTATRGHVAMHLEEAKKVQATMKNTQASAK